jgi:hypothetical protein
VLPRTPSIQQSRPFVGSCRSGSKQERSWRIFGCVRCGRTPHCVA